MAGLIVSSQPLPPLLAEFLQAAGADPARPHITENDEGETVLEWWALAPSPRRVTVYFEGGVVTGCVRSWGFRIATEMEACDSLTPAELRTALSWLDTP